MICSRRTILKGLTSSFLLVFAGSAWALAQSQPLHEDAQITDSLNQIRQSHGLPSLQWNEKLHQAALTQAKRMAKHERVKHNLGWGNGFKVRLRQQGIAGAAAENIAAGQKDYKQALNAWMESPGHRHNMLDPGFFHYGLAAASNPNKPHYFYWALVIGR